MSDPNYYEMLEIAPDATPEEVREAYRLLTMVWHPDRFPKDSKLWTHANEKMQQINEAYNALKNIKDTDPHSAAAQAPQQTSSPNQSTHNSAVGAQQRRAQEREKQRWEAQRRVEEQERHIQEQQRRIQEQRQREEEQQRREEEQQRREAEARLNIESEHRRVEAERLRLLMKEKQRIEEVQHQRAAQGLCTLCGKPLSSIEKITRRTRHRDCSVFVDDASSPNINSQTEEPRAPEAANDY